MMRPWTTAVFLFVLAGRPAAAQVGHEPADAHLRNQCRLAAQVLNTGQPAPKRRWAVEFISNCAESGPAALVEAWARVPSDTAAVRELIGASSRLRDRRLYVQAMALIRDPSRPEVARVGAMILAMYYVDPSYSLSFPLLAPREGPIRMITAVSLHPIPQLNGTVPMQVSVATPVLDLLREVAMGDPSPRVRYAAARLEKTLAFDLQRGYVQ
jgi:hypothetical protein